MRSSPLTNDVDRHPILETPNVSLAIAILHAIVLHNGQFVLFVRLESHIVVWNVMLFYTCMSQRHTSEIKKKKVAGGNTIMKLILHLRSTFFRSITSFAIINLKKKKLY